MPGLTNHQKPPPTSSPSSSPGPIAQQLVQLQGAGQTPPNPPQPTITSGKTPNKKKGKPWKEIRKWLNIVGILLIPLLIGVYTIGNNIQQTDLAKRQHDSDQHIAQQNRQADVANQLDQQRETALKTYEDDISSLLLDRHLATSRPGDEVRTVALAKTLEVLHQLDGPRNAHAIQFLQDAQLIGADLTTKTPHTHNIIDFSNADLTNDDLSFADLRGTSLTGADLTRADLTGAYLAGADLTKAYLIEANLIEADLTRADLTGADLTRANLTRAYLTGAYLTRAYLTGANLTGANLTRADLTGADLTRADLTRADLTRADLTGADLTGADLTGADQIGAYLSGTIMPNGTQHSCLPGKESFCN
jgi:uncharacterized protein YjbI with pentapeptide repeats